MNCSLVNIHNKGRKIFLFTRNEKGEQKIIEDNSFFPYFYEKDTTGQFTSFKGEKLTKIVCSDPKEISKRRTKYSFEADLLPCKRYLIDKIDNIEKTVIKYFFIDIEVQCDELPDVTKAKYPVSCISVYNSESKKIVTFWIVNYKTEYEMLEDFSTYVKQETPDLWLSWNVKFDYDYLFHRVPDFAKKISPIGEERYGKRDEKENVVHYPAGLAIVDQMDFFKKVTLNRERSYALDNVAQKYFKEPKWGKTDFSKITKDIKEKNVNDVNRMLKIEQRFKLISYFDEIRRMAKVEWEDLLLNSRMIDSLLLQEGKKQGKVLPSKIREEDAVETEYEGAYRQIFDTGLFKGIGKADLSSAYPMAIIDFCLDSANIDENNEKGVSIEDSYFIQDKQALLPTIVKKLINLKVQIKQQLEKAELNTIEYKDLKIRYDAIKGLCNSGYGVFGNRFFRLYDQRVASATTFLVRDLLHYVEDKLRAENINILYLDTDSCFYNIKDDITSKLNNYVKQWAKEKYNVDTNIEFAYEGYFEKVLLIARCRYIGLVNKGIKGTEEEIKGVEVKRGDASAYTKEFQRGLFDRVLNEESQESIINWIKEETKRIKTLTPEQIGFPCRLKPAAYTKNLPVFLRALNNTPQLKKKPGDLYYYIYVKDREEVLAFDEEKKDHIKNIDFDKMIERNITNKVDVIFKAMSWDTFELFAAIKGQRTLGL